MRRGDPDMIRDFLNVFFFILVCLAIVRIGWELGAPRAAPVPTASSKP